MFWRLLDNLDHLAHAAACGAFYQATIAICAPARNGDAAGRLRRQTCAIALKFLERAGPTFFVAAPRFIVRELGLREHDLCSLLLRAQRHVDAGFAGIFRAEGLPLGLQTDFDCECVVSGPGR